MQDEPTPTEILASVASFLRDEVLPQLTGACAFQLRVAANALDLVRRELMISPEQEARENDVLRALLGRDGETKELMSELARGIADKRIDPAAPQVEAFLWEATEAKLAVDQPGYAGLKRVRALRAGTNQQE